MQESIDGNEIYGIVRDWGIFWVIEYESQGLELSIEMSKTAKNKHLKDGDEVSFALLMEVDEDA